MGVAKAPVCHELGDGDLSEDIQGIQNWADWSGADSTSHDIAASLTVGDGRFVLYKRNS